MHIDRFSIVIIALLLVPGMVLESCTTAGTTLKNDAARVISPSSIGLLAPEIDRILDDSSLASCLIGIKIVALDDGATLYERNSNKLLHPASNMKLLTSATAMNVLDREFQFRTAFFANGTVANGVLRGDVCVKGSGDPLIKTEDLDSVAAKIAASGIRTITGDIVGDVSYFDSLYWGRGWMWDDEPESDEAFVSPLTVNGNSVEVQVTPGKGGSSGVVAINPFTSYVSLVNSTTTTTDTLVPPLSVWRPMRVNAIQARGRISPLESERKFALSVWQPERYFVQLLREQLERHSITVRGVARIDSIRSGMQLAEIIHPIDSVLHMINKPSDNISAENTLRTIAAEVRGGFGSAEKGLGVMKEFLMREGIDTTNMILADGSGVSWYNAITPDCIIQLLRKQYEHKETFTRFYESLPIAGVDGTLKNRMKGTYAAGNVHAKTGSLTGVSSISGYVTNRDGKMLTFSILCNHFPREIASLRAAQDRILTLLASWSSKAN